MFRRILSFRIKIGGGSGCESADFGDDVTVEYKPIAYTTYVEIGRMAYNGIELFYSSIAHGLAVRHHAGCV